MTVNCASAGAQIATAAARDGDTKRMGTPCSGWAAEGDNLHVGGGPYPSHGEGKAPLDRASPARSAGTTGGTVTNTLRVPPRACRRYAKEPGATAIAPGSSLLRSVAALVRDSLADDQARGVAGHRA